VGDSLREDVTGATLAGAFTLRIRRSGPEHRLDIQSLTRIAQLIRKIDAPTLTE
jgi:hypothetical protein